MENRTSLARIQAVIAAMAAVGMGGRDALMQRELRDSFSPPPKRSKHQTHARKGRYAERIGAKAIMHPAGSKLAKQFAKAAIRGPRGY